MPIDIHPERTEVLSLHKGDRSRLREIVGACLVGAFVAFLLIYCVSPARADTRKFENQNAIVQFLDAPCELNVEGKADMRSAQGDFTMIAQTPFGMFPMGRIDMKGCWKLTEAGYETVWEDGEKITFRAKDVQTEGV